LASIIVASYNQAEVLEMSLAAYARQSATDFEVIVADDGSVEDYSEILRFFAPRFAHGIQHVKHEDRGFRKTRILNRAICVARFDRLVFTDSDCLPHRDFLQHHLSYLERGTVVSGRRVHVERGALPTAKKILETGLDLSPLHLIRLKLLGRARVIEHGFVTPFLYEARRSAILGSNFSVYKDDLKALNGFNEEYREWGLGEDTDIDFRLRLSGVKVRVFRNRMIQYHVAHPQNHSGGEANRRVFERTQATRRVRSPQGLAEITSTDFTLTRYA
jgi:glycosyltransferase involved in cell wall biosynthesis